MVDTDMDWIRRNWFLFILLVGSLQGTAQSSMIYGVVRDVNTKQPLPSVTVAIKNVKGGVVSDSAGNFTVRYDKPFTQLVFSIVGYKTQTVTVQPGMFSTAPGAAV